MNRSDGTRATPERGGGGLRSALLVAVCGGAVLVAGSGGQAPRGGPSRGPSSDMPPARAPRVGVRRTGVPRPAAPRPVPPPASVLARYDFDAAPSVRWKLPHALDEISGLATDGAGRLFAHDDERAIIYLLDPGAQRVVKQFAFGHPAARGDFEAIAVLGDRILLTTSNGVIYAGREGADGEAVPFVTYRTGVGKQCEVEGLAVEEAGRSLLLACKTPRVGSLQHQLAVYAWSLDHPAAVAVLRLRIQAGPVAHQVGHESLYPSELAREPTSGHLLLLAAHAHAIVELNAAGQIVAVARLRGALHPQPESLAFASDGTLLIGDEASGGRATLTAYPPMR